MPIDPVTPTEQSEKSDFDSGATFKPPNQETSIITRDPLPSQQQFCLRWNNYQTNLTFVFDQLLQTESFCDVTLACDKASIKAHKMVLSACSPYFQALFFDNPCQHPIIIMKDVKWHELKAIVEFMYKGEINVGQDQIGGLLKLAEMLKIRGLADVNGEGETPEAKTPSGSVQKMETERVTPRSSTDFGNAPAETPTPVAKSSRKRRWSVGEGSDVDSPIDESNLETIDAAASPIPPIAAAIGNPPKTPTQISPYPPIPPALDNMNLTALSINQPEDLEIKPGIAEMIREEERAKLLENSQAWLQNSTSSTIAAESYQYQLQSMWQKCWNSQNLIHHLRFRERGPLKSWRPETMAEAIFSVLKEGLSLSQAARKFDIPYPTFVLYANRVHNMLGPSIDGGTDLRPKGRGRPQRILLGIWPDEHIKGVIKSVVFRDAKDLKDEQMHMYGRQSPYGFQDPAMNFSVNANGLGQATMLPPQESLSPDAVTAATVAAVRQQMCNMVAMNNFNLPPQMGSGALTIHPSGAETSKANSSPNNPSAKSSRTSSNGSPTTSRNTNNNNKSTEDSNNTNLAHLNSSSSISITRLGGASSLAHDLRMISSGENSPEMIVEPPAVNLAFNQSRDFLSPSSSAHSDNLYQSSHDYSSSGQSFKESAAIKLEPLAEMRSD